MSQSHKRTQKVLRINCTWWWRKKNKKKRDYKWNWKWFLYIVAVSMRVAFIWGHSPFLTQPDEWVEKKIEQKINGSLTFPYMRRHLTHICVYNDSAICIIFGEKKKVPKNTQIVITQRQPHRHLSSASSRRERRAKFKSTLYISRVYWLST